MINAELKVADWKALSSYSNLGIYWDELELLFGTPCFFGVYQEYVLLSYPLANLKKSKQSTLSVIQSGVDNQTKLAINNTRQGSHELICHFYCIQLT